jgi:hypothetical protein
VTTPRTEAFPQGGRPAFGLPSTGGSRAAHFGARGTLFGLAAVAVVVGGLIWSAATGQAPPSEKPRIFGGALVLDDYRPLTVIDVATGSVTVRLIGVYAQVGASNYSQVQAVPTAAGTFLINRATGAFNLLGKDDYVLGPPTGGISLGSLAGLSGARGFAAGQASYIVRFAPSSTVSLVGVATAEAVASHTHQAVRPMGFAKLAHEADRRPGGATVSGGDLWLLEGTGKSCTLLRLSPSSSAPLGLSTTAVSTLPIPCGKAALEPSGGEVAVALPGRVETFGSSGRAGSIAVAKTRRASAFLPVQGVTGGAFFLARDQTGWVVFGTAKDRLTSGPVPLLAFGPASQPAVPAYSRGLIYTLDQAQAGQPRLWTVNPATGVMKPVAGVPNYPALSTEKASFQGAEVLVDGPRVIFNNPGSLLAVVVFTDGSHAPVIVNKSDAVVVSAAGPGDANVKAKTAQHHPATKPKAGQGRTKTGHKPSPPPIATTTVPTTVAKPVVPPPLQPAAQPVTQQINCATTTVKPYQPRITSVSPSDQSALVTWSYHLLDEQDCLPSTWSVTVAALGGTRQPSQPTQVVNGQEQLLVTGLRPGGHYEAVVTAYIAKQSTASAPYAFTTTKVGPGPPSSVTVVANGQGGWVVSWVPCRGQAACAVPAARWSVLGTSCGSFVASPPSVSVPGSQTSVIVNAGNDSGLLGDSLRFSVQGLSSAGLPGTPTSSSRCSQSWQPPNPADLALLAAGEPLGQTITAQLSVTVVQGAAQVAALGGDQVTYTFSVASPGAGNAHQISVGPISTPEASVPGLNPAQTYRATVTVSPVGHPLAAVTLSSAPFTKTLPWPSDLHMQVSASVGPDANAGTAVATFPGLPPGPFQAQGNIACASVVTPVRGDLSERQFLATVNLDQMGGACSISLVLKSTLAPDPYGVPSPVLTAPFSIGHPPSYSFSAQAAEPCTKCKTLDLSVSYDGPGQPAGTDWRVSAVAPGSRCSSGWGLAPTADFPVTLKWPLSCPVPAIRVSWLYLGQSSSASAALPALPTTTTAPPPVTTLPTTNPGTTSTLAPSTTTAKTTTTAKATMTTPSAPATTSAPPPSTTTLTTSTTTGTGTTTAGTTTTTSATTTTSPSTTTTVPGTTTTTTSETTTTTAGTTTTTSATTTTASTTTTSASTTTSSSGTTSTTPPTTTASPSTSGSGGALVAALGRPSDGPPASSSPSPALEWVLFGMLVTVLGGAMWLLSRTDPARAQRARQHTNPALEATT